MSSSDANSSEQIVGGRGATEEAAGAALETRKQQNDTFGGRFQEGNRHGDETETDQHIQPSSGSRAREHAALSCDVDRPSDEELPGCGEPKFGTQRPVGRRFTAFLSFRLSSRQGRKPGPGGTEPAPRKETQPYSHSLPGAVGVNPGGESSQVNGRISPSETSVEPNNDLISPEKISFPVKKEKEVVPDSIHSRLTDSFLNDELGPYDYFGLQTVPSGSQPRRTGFGSVESEEDTKRLFKKLEAQNHLVELSAAMLSSTMVSVLAPHWSSRLRRTKRGTATEDLEVQGNLQNVTYGSNEQSLETQRQRGGERRLIHGSDAHERPPLLGIRRGTVGWSSMSGPSSLNLDYASKRPVVQSVSLDVGSGRLDNRKIEGDVFNPVATTATSVSPLSLDPHEHERMSQDGHQGQLSPSSSKPTTSSLLLSLRRLNSNWRNSNLSPTVSEKYPLSLTGSTSDRAAEFSMPHPSPTSPNNNEQNPPLPYSSSTSYRTTETDHIISSSSPNCRKGEISNTPFFSASPDSKDSEGPPSSHSPQTTSGTYPTRLCPRKQTCLTSRLSENQQKCRTADKTAEPISETLLSSSKLSQYDRYAFLKSQSLPRGTTLRSASWWKQATQEGSSPPRITDPTNININNKSRPNTPLVTPCNNNNDLDSSCNDNNRFGSQIPNNRDNNNTAQSVLKGNLNFAFKTKGGASGLRQSNAEDRPDQLSDRFLKHPDGLNVNDRVPQKSNSLPSVSFRSKISIPDGQTTLTHPKDHSKVDVSNRSFKGNVTELPLALLNPKSPNAPTASISNHKTHDKVSKASDKTPTSPHRFRASYDFYPPSLDNSNSMGQDTQSHLKSLSCVRTSQSTSEKTDLIANTLIHSSVSSPTTTSLTSKTTLPTNQTENKSLDSTNTLNSRALSPKTFSGPLSSPHTKTSSYCNTQLLASQTSVLSVSATGSTPHPLSSKVPITADTKPQPLGFERTYPSIPKSVQPKTISTLISTPHVKCSPKTNYSPLSTTPTPSSTTLSGLPFSTTSTLSTSLLTPPITPTLTSSTTTVTSSSLLTPPATPTLTRTISQTISLPRGERTFSGSLDLSPKKKAPRQEGKRLRRVTWQDSVDLQYSEATKVQTSELSQPRPQVQTSPLSPSRPVWSVDAPSIFSFLRVGSPTGTTSPLCPRSSKTTSIQVWRGGKSQQSVSSDFANQAPRDGGRVIDMGGVRASAKPGPERTLSGETNTAQCHSSSSLSLPPDFAGGYKLRYSSPPYSTLKATRSSQGETKNTAPTSPITKCDVSETDQANNNNYKLSRQCDQNAHTSLVHNKAGISSQPLPITADKALDSPSACVNVIETLVYSLSTAALDTTPKSLTQHITNTQNSTGSSSKESRCSSAEGADDECGNRIMKESEACKTGFILSESKKEISLQIPKKGLFAFKNSVSSPNARIAANQEAPCLPDKAWPETDGACQGSNKMDQVLSRLRQTLSGKCFDDDLVFSSKRRQTSQTPSVSGSSDISDVSDITVESNNTFEGERDGEQQNRYTLIPNQTVDKRTAGSQFSIWPDNTATDYDQNNHSVLDVFQKDKSAFVKEQWSENKTQAGWTSHSPTRHRFDDRVDCKPTNQSLHRDLSPARHQFWNPNLSATFPTQCRNSTASPRSPFSLSPLSPFTPTDGTDDSVFYSPKLQRQRESTSLCEPEVWGRALSPERSQASTGPLSGGLCQERECLAYSSCADLKYGIEARRSISVSSVLSSRPSGPGRISTGSRVMSVSDLTDPALTFEGPSFRGNGRGLDQWSVKSGLTSKNKCQSVDNYRATSDYRVSSAPSDPGKMRSRSLPRSLTRSLSNWSSEFTEPLSLTTTTTKPGHLWSPTNLDTPHVAWDTEGPPTPPPSPPRSPPSRRMSKPPSLSSPASPSSPGVPQDSQSPRGHLPSRGYVSSLTAFEESSDSSSDTTTDDEYYLETGEDEEKESEL